MNDFIAQQGWQCPICKRVYSPSTPCCFTCGAESTTTTNTNGFVTQDDYVYNQKTHRFEIIRLRAEEVNKEAENE